MYKQQLKQHMEKFSSKLTDFTQLALNQLMDDEEAQACAGSGFK